MGTAEASVFLGKDLVGDKKHILPWLEDPADPAIDADPVAEVVPLGGCTPGQPRIGGNMETGRADHSLELPGGKVDLVVGKPGLQTEVPGRPPDHGRGKLETVPVKKLPQHTGKAPPNWTVMAGEDGEPGGLEGIVTFRDDHARPDFKILEQDIAGKSTCREKVIPGEGLEGQGARFENRGFQVPIVRRIDVFIDR